MAEKRTYKVAWWFTEKFFNKDFFEYGLKRIKERSGLIDEILPCWYVSDKDGRITRQTKDDRVKATRELCAELGIKLIPLVIANSTEDLKHLLSDERLQRQHIKIIVEELEKNDFVGIDVDYECLPPEFRQRNTDFFCRLGTEMKEKGRLLSMPLHPKARDFDPTVPGADAQDWPQLVKYIDNLRVMCYDQHHPAYTGPGPVLAYPWARKVMEYASSIIPKEKLYMGLPTYGHDWDLSGSGNHLYRGFGEVKEIVARHKAEVLWDRENRTPHFQYTTGKGLREIWFSDQRSFSEEADIVLENRVAGISIWVLADEDPGVWGVIEKKLKG